MNPLRTLDDRLMLAVNSFARHTGWLHAPVLAYASYGVVLFAALLLAGVLVARHGSDPRPRGGGMGLSGHAARGRAQPAGGPPLRRGPAVRRPPRLLRLADPTKDFSFPSTTPSWPARSPRACCWSPGGSVWSPPRRRC